MVTLTIFGSKFVSNKGGMGGGINVEDIKLSIDKSFFTKNTASQGGGLYFALVEILNNNLEYVPKISNSIFESNKADIGGAIKSVGIDI
jgi:predicted outer membrane repeat protein